MRSSNISIPFLANFKWEFFRRTMSWRGFIAFDFRSIICIAFPSQMRAWCFRDTSLSSRVPSSTNQMTTIQAYRLSINSISLDAAWVSRMTRNKNTVNTTGNSDRHERQFAEIIDDVLRTELRAIRVVVQRLFKPLGMIESSGLKSRATTWWCRKFPGVVRIGRRTINMWDWSCIS